MRRPMTGRCSPRSCTCSPADVRGGTCRPRSGSRFLLRTEGLPRGWQPGCSKNCIVRCSTNSVVRANSTGRQQSWTRQASGQKGGIADRAESGRPRQEGIEDPRPVRNKRNPTGRRCVRGEYSRQHDAATNGGSDSGNEVQARTTPTQAGKASRRQGLRLRHSPTVAARTRHRPADRPPRHRAKRPPRPVPVEDRTHHVRREALCRIPGSVGKDLEGGSWVGWLTWIRKVKGTRACQETRWSGPVVGATHRGGPA
ncbi:hypothetical protein MLGJGCBP_09367 [Rhodococcus sp. T7]|nr:hypothetical protein MLGJGCBP_09367 [Rhodococcus sp. T7]